MELRPSRRRNRRQWTTVTAAESLLSPWIAGRRLQPGLSRCRQARPLDDAEKTGLGVGSLGLKSSGKAPFGFLVISSLLPTPRDGVALRMSPVAVTESLLAGSNEAVGLLGERGEVLYVGDGTSLMLGHPPEVAARMSLRQLVHPDDIGTLTHAFQTVLVQRGARQTLVVRARHAAGYFRTLQCHLLNALDVRGLRAVVVRLTERRASSEFPGAWATRTQLEEALQRCLTRQQAGDSHGFCVLCLRLEHFGKMEAGLGTEQAHQVLQEVGRRIRACVPPETVIANLGRGEIVALLEGVDDTDSANRLADTMSEAARGPVDVGGQHVPASLVTGVATSGRAYSRPQDLVRDATAAASRAGGGRRRAVFETRMRDEERRYLSVLGDLR